MAKIFRFPYQYLTYEKRLEILVDMLQSSLLDRINEIKAQYDEIQELKAKILELESDASRK